MFVKISKLNQLKYIDHISFPDNILNNHINSDNVASRVKNKKDKIKRKIVCQPLKNGGLNFINFGIMVESVFSMDR